MRQQRPVGDQLGHPLAAVDQDAQLRRLRPGAQDRDLVDRQRLDQAAVGAGRAHPQRVDHRLLGRRQPLDAAGPRRRRSSGSRPCRGSSRRPAARGCGSRAASRASARRRRARRSPRPPRPGAARAGRSAASRASSAIATGLATKWIRSIANEVPAREGRHCRPRPARTQARRFRVPRPGGSR